MNGNRENREMFGKKDKSTRRFLPGRVAEDDEELQQTKMGIF
jgi:hypothetical protein